MHLNLKASKTWNKFLLNNLMGPFYSIFNKLFNSFFDSKTQKIIEKIILISAGLGFGIHLILIFLNKQKTINSVIDSRLFCFGVNHKVSFQYVRIQGGWIE